MARNSGASRRAQRAKQHQQHHRNQIALAALAVVAIVGVVVVLLAGGGDDDGTATVDVDMFEFGFAGELTAPAGPLRISATNTGRINHNVGIRGGPITNEVAPGGRVLLELDQLAPGTYELYCDISGHAAAGMTASLVIIEAPAT